MLTPDKIKIAKTIDVKNVFALVLYDNGILEVIWDEVLGQIETEHVKLLGQMIGKIGEGKRMRVYISVSESISISIDALNYAASKESQKYTLANAVLVDSLAKRLVVNYFLRVNKPVAITKTFNTRQEAFEWLLSILPN